MKLNHNTLALIVPIVVAVFIIGLVYAIPEIGIAPVEEVGRSSIKLAMFMAAWPLSLRFLGGTKYSITENAKSTPYGMAALACAVIVGLAIVMTVK